MHVRLINLLPLHVRDDWPLALGQRDGLPSLGPGGGLNLGLHWAYDHAIEWRVRPAGVAEREGRLERLDPHPERWALQRAEWLGEVVVRLAVRDVETRAHASGVAHDPVLVFLLWMKV
jgi:hypothetical protein